MEHYLMEWDVYPNEVADFLYEAAENREAWFDTGRAADEHLNLVLEHGVDMDTVRMSLYSRLSDGYSDFPVACVALLPKKDLTEENLQEVCQNALDSFMEKMQEKNQSAYTVITHYNEDDEVEDVYFTDGKDSHILDSFYDDASHPFEACEESIVWVDTEGKIQLNSFRPETRGKDFKETFGKPFLVDDKPFPAIWLDGSRKATTPAEEVEEALKVVHDAVFAFHDIANHAMLPMSEQNRKLMDTVRSAVPVPPNQNVRS